MGVMGPAPMPGAPSPELVEDVIRRACAHPLGTDFLENGSLDAVAATFGVHAFVVDAAREALREMPAPDVVGTSVAV